MTPDPTRALADTALSAVLVGVGRAAAGLPPLPVP